VAYVDSTYRNDPGKFSHTYLHAPVTEQLNLVSTEQLRRYATGKWK